MKRALDFISHSPIQHAGVQCCPSTLYHVDRRSTHPLDHVGSNHLNVNLKKTKPKQKYSWNIFCYLSYPPARRRPVYGRFWPGSRPVPLPAAWPRAALHCDTPFLEHTAHRASPAAGLGRSERSPRPAPRTIRRPPAIVARASAGGPLGLQRWSNLWRGKRRRQRGRWEEMSQHKLAGNVCVILWGAEQ